LRNFSPVQDRRHDVSASIPATTDIPQSLRASFFGTFDGVSELSVCEPTPRTLSISVAVTSFSSIVAIQIICLWQEGWLSGGIFMVLVGYVCMVTGVSAAAYMIYSSCEGVTMSTRDKTMTADWNRGIVVR
jgi:hypothetical protein